MNYDVNNKNVIANADLITLEDRDMNQITNKVFDIPHGFDIYAEHIGSTKRFWINSVDTGRIYIGPRQGSDLLDLFKIRTREISIDSTGNVTRSIKTTTSGISVDNNEIWHDGNTSGRVTNTEIATSTIKYSNLNLGLVSVSVSSLPAGTTSTYSLGLLSDLDEIGWTAAVSTSISGSAKIQTSIYFDANAGHFYIVATNHGTASWVGELKFYYFKV